VGWKILALLVFFRVVFVRWQKPNVLKCAVGFSTFSHGIQHLNRWQNVTYPHCRFFNFNFYSKML